VHQAVANAEALKPELPGRDRNPSGAALSSVTFSAGIAQHGAADTLAHTLDHADLALYRAKQAGRNRSITRNENLGGAAVMLGPHDSQSDIQRERRAAAAQALRPSLLHLLCVIQVFNMITLTASGSRIVGGSAVLMLLMALIAMQLLGRAGLSTEMLNIAAASRL
jgi:hypothetical protein